MTLELASRGASTQAIMDECGAVVSSRERQDVRTVAHAYLVRWPLASAGEVAGVASEPLRRLLPRLGAATAAAMICGWTLE